MSIPEDSQQISNIFSEMKQNTQDLQTINLKFRKEAAQKLIDGYESMKGEFDQALKKDLGQNPFIANFYSHAGTLNQCRHTIKNFEEWSKDVKVPTPVLLGVAKSQINYQPLGLTLVIGPWNYPIICSIVPVVASICAGNSVILKPSQMAPYTSNALKHLFDKHMDQRYYRCVQGGVKISQALSQLPFDMICFTGSPRTGRLVAIQAAKNLTPCLLQLGGKSPTIIDETANISNAVLKIIFGKFANCGQTCVGVDYIFVHQSIKQKFKKQLLIKIKEAYSTDKLSESGDYSKIITYAHYDRIQEYLKQNHGGNVLYEGKRNREQRFMGPVVIQSPSENSLVMKQEIFGPILPIVYYNNLSEVIREINSKPKPLALYIFSSNDKNIQLIKNSTSSGGLMVNDTIIHLLNPDLPFGGVGNSGTGRYHGKAGFQAFSNIRSTVYTTPMNIYPLTNRFPPYTDMKKKQMTFLLKMGSITYQGLGKGFKYVLLAAGGLLYYKYGLPKPRM